MSLLAAYNVDEGVSDATVVDRAGNRNDFTLTNSGVTRAAGHTGYGLSNTGNANPAYPPNIGQTANRTVMLWAKGPNTTPGWLIQWYVSTIDSGCWGILNISGSIHIQARNATTLARASTARPADISTTWHHIAGTYDGANVRLYLDGVLKATSALTGPLRSDAVLQLYGYTESNVIDDIAIYDEVLDVTAIAAAAATPVGTDSGTYAFI
ncbi:LamG-like jellyroll fold domain-containing protein [Amycolatopsis kentuckyensis]|uniref:LamG-like jellyroll fold domain-containing protein n=1 Tax=Amycolatopsis kentuckyensis TaxID=218823 RepID=UPI003568D7DE